MNHKDQFYTVVDDRNRQTREFIDLQAENAELRKAMQHYYWCVTCAQDSFGSCSEGSAFAIKFGLYVPDDEKDI